MGDSSERPARVGSRVKCGGGRSYRALKARVRVMEHSRGLTD